MRNGRLSNAATVSVRALFGWATKAKAWLATSQLDLKKTKQQLKPSALIIVMTALPTLGLAEPGKNRGADNDPPVDRGEVTEVGLTWQGIVNLVDADPRIAVGRQRTAAARAAVDAAGAVPNPSIRGSIAYGRARDGSASAVEWGLGLSIPLGWIAQRGAKIGGASAQARVTLAESQALRRDVLLQLRVLFWNLVYEQERVAALTELGNQTVAFSNTVQRRVEKGESRPVEGIRVAVEAEKIAGELAAARSALDARGAQLGAWLGVPANRKLKAMADLTKLPMPLTALQTRASVRTAHPVIAAATARVQALVANVTVERRVRVPTVSIQAFTDHELDRSAYGGGLAIGFPLWNWNTGNIHRAEAELAAGRKRLEAEQLEIETAAIAAQASCQAGTTLATRYKDRIVPQAASVARIIEKTYELGDATLLDVIDARRTLIDTRRQFLSTLIQTHTDCSRLAAFVGEELP